MISKTTMAGVGTLVLLLGGCGLEAHDAVRNAVSGPTSSSGKAIAPIEIAPRPGIPPTIEEAPDTAAQPATDDVIDMSLG
jgi:hypothetical protein